MHILQEILENFKFRYCDLIYIYYINSGADSDDRLNSCIMMKIIVLKSSKKLEEV